MPTILDHHEQLIESLTRDVRFLSVSQIAHQWYSGEEGIAHEMIRKLEEAQLVVRESHLLHPELEIKGPEFTWSPGDPEPDLGPVAYRLRKRWCLQKQMMDLIFPTKGACEHFGGVRVRPRASEFSHDLHLAGVYLFLHNHVIPGSDLHWVSGDMLRSDGSTGDYGGHVPDAVLVNAQGQLHSIVEGGGSYARTKLAAIHREYRERAYQIW
ncbi:hypothetical protein [Bythopirellula goksoeyrii]|uniref:Uncharacterized protein n=1 Tax=Bythopirellula goksoeyrii TaxID=1400387 RepID=A0A5B9Q9V8_9BACT|nr:hypothetical protein [Bythopirellula goksoeyrii]QEG35834.1 hypothetical protein Pr1d_31400 [Bythopirellula goksoeyrii]